MALSLSLNLSIHSVESSVCITQLLLLCNGLVWWLLSWLLLLLLLLIVVPLWWKDGEEVSMRPAKDFGPV